MVEQMEIPAEMTPIQIKEYHSVFPDPDEKDRLCVRIEKGLFAGLGVAYGKFQLSDKENDDGTTKVRYEYDFEPSSSPNSGKKGSVIDYEPYQTK